MPRFSVTQQMLLKLIESRFCRIKEGLWRCGGSVSIPLLSVHFLHLHSDHCKNFAIQDLKLIASILYPFPAEGQPVIMTILPSKRNE
jgi:hypothetical protein